MKIKSSIISSIILFLASSNLSLADDFNQKKESFRNFVDAFDDKYLENHDKEILLNHLKNGDWYFILIRNQDDKNSLENIIDKYSPSNEDWAYAITHKEGFIKIAKSKGIFESLNKEQWVEILKNNISVKEDFLSSNAKLFKVYCDSSDEQIKEEILSLNRINRIKADKITQDKKNFIEGNALKLQEFYDLFSIYPELADRLNPKDFQNFNRLEWVQVLESGITEKDVIFKYIPWENFKLRDWVQILYLRDDLYTKYTEIIKVKEFGMEDIARAINIASISGVDSFNKYKIWNSLSKEIYIYLLKEENLFLVLDIPEYIYKKPMNTLEDLDKLDPSLISLSNEELKSLYKAYNEGDLEKLKEKLPGCNTIYNSAYLYTVAENIGILQTFTEGDWKTLLKEDPSSFEYYIKAGYLYDYLINYYSVENKNSVLKILNEQSNQDILQLFNNLKSKEEKESLILKLEDLGFFAGLDINDWIFFLKEGVFIDYFKNWELLSLAQKLELLNAQEENIFSKLNLNIESMPYDVAENNNFIMSEIKKSKRSLANHYLKNIDLEENIKFFKENWFSSDITSEQKHTFLNHYLKSLDKIDKYDINKNGYSEAYTEELTNITSFLMLLWKDDKTIFNNILNSYNPDILCAMTSELKNRSPNENVSIEQSNIFKMNLEKEKLTIKSMRTKFNTQTLNEIYYLNIAANRGSAQANHRLGTLFKKQAPSYAISKESFFSSKTMIRTDNELSSSYLRKAKTMGYKALEPRQSNPRDYNYRY